MNEEMIGTLAGKIWAVLSEQPMTVKELKTITKLKKQKSMQLSAGCQEKENDRYPKGKRFRLLLELKIPIRKKMY